MSAPNDPHRHDCRTQRAEADAHGVAHAYQSAMATTAREIADALGVALTSKELNAELTRQALQIEGRELADDGRVFALLELGADPNSFAIPWAKIPILMRFLSCGRANAARLVLDAGADVTAVYKNKSQKRIETALSAAQESLFSESRALAPEIEERMAAAVEAAADNAEEKKEKAASKQAAKRKAAAKPKRSIQKKGKRTRAA